MEIHRSDHDGGVRVLRIDRPPANAINREFLQRLHAEAEAADDDEAVRALVVTGTGRFFSAGLDLKEMAAGGARELASLGGGADGIYRLWRVGKPTIAMVGGHALAGGAILMLACDFRIAARGAFKIGVTETALGLPLPNGAFQIARFALQGRDVRRALLEAEGLDPERACAAGLVDEVVAPEDLEARCLAFAERLGRHPSAAYGFQKYKLQAEANHWIRQPVDAGTERFHAPLSDPSAFARLLAGRAEGRAPEGALGGGTAGGRRAD
ncbi:MAG TPA: enoyl-CoA hydratase/isomerase family protein [Candidatus Binatia bacterium]|nr:enoyl-CoA hydratase/isomerase family protein [Candidatus Binatia bacterium]